MPTIAQNLQAWDREYQWPFGGDEWSAMFGSTDALWSFVIYPRIRRFLPTGRILEIGPGFGRWTNYLRRLCDSMVLVDLSPRCIEECRRRFGSSPAIEYVVNDGVSLAGVADGSVDFVFSFDSLVHAEKDVIGAYLRELKRKLSKDGVGFIHHSNLGAYGGRLQINRSLPGRAVRRLIGQRGLGRLLSINLSAWRAESVTAPIFEEFSRGAGLPCISQELVAWERGRCLVDGLSTFTTSGSRWERNNVVFRNRQFLATARGVRSLADVYP